ncbi:hypothetical protein T12_3590 [Trichinella patagoniensis]|uniref:Uncharacterized protein n=1 Tax=Trichinella patagoniensis TaxID=990121 RepID=A0A0V1ADT5_9BILA|nr:hypothetical protein T12_3590 [Trichinella patagoniensis]
MLAYHHSRLTKTRLQNVDRLGIIFRSERDSFNGAPRHPFCAGQQVCKCGGIVQITPFVNIGLEQGPKQREFQHLPFKLREGHLRQPPVTGPNSRPASTNTVTVDGAFSARLDHPGARSRFPHSVALTTCHPSSRFTSRSSSTSVWRASAARKVSSIKETCSSTSKASADPMHNSSSSASKRFNRSLRATSFLLRVFVADAMVSTFHR